MNIKSIAKISGVSVATVSRVLNNESGVSEKLRLRTLSAIEGRGYQPRESSTRRARIAMVVEPGTPTFDNFFAQIFTGISSYAFANNVETTLLYHAQGDVGELDVVELLRKKRCNGVIFLSPLSRERAESLVEARIPAVVVASRCEVPGVGFIDCDSRRSAYEQTEYLIRLGHRRIGFLCGSLDGIIDHQERLDAYKQALADSDIELELGWVIPHVPTDVTERAGYDQANQLLDCHSDVTAIFATNDAMAYGAISACVERGLRVPEDVSVIGHDDNPTSKYYNPSLTTTRQPLRDMGTEAAQWVDLKLKGKLDTMPSKVIHGDLIVRRSCAPVKISS
ncbi:LacI family DNA-binding transcriptional regulator [Coraliomargarita sp. SDUM461004]|uniref:LacI family DNA-binding transcriptional regulator n=1 Tax=Thalassobacterium sedimentorum TaxID=3041258 RepID=A0ABU1ALW6_9BACT|nr:LacI family DNA-binding transcriptional regulator [Coraliomargarita sp. SDUM461004]MDQ8194766.1 LacI family DNA-binding transcriptional regulator [Coraliomargarita sp. SDUM461004]